MYLKNKLSFQGSVHGRASHEHEKPAFLAKLPANITNPSHDRAHNSPYMEAMSVAHRYRSPLLALLLSGGLLAGAWISQHGFGYAPCQMCYWQRHAHKAVVVLALIALLAAKLDWPLRRFVPLVLALALLGSAGLAFFHSGVEFGFWEGPKTCSSGDVSLPSFNTEDPFAALDEKIKPPSCSEAVWFFLGLSMATWNGVLSLGGAIMVFILGRTQRG